MINLSLTKELLFLSYFFNSNLESTFKLNSELYPQELKVTINTNLIEVYYGGQKIWKEKIEVDNGFNLESCHSIDGIIRKINSGDNSWKRDNFGIDIE